MKINALCTEQYEQAVGNCNVLLYCCNESIEDNGCRILKFIPFAEDGFNDKTDIYVPSLIGDDIVEMVCDRIVNSRCRAIVRAAYDLNEAGLIEAKYKLSPIMLLHKMGVLDRCVIAGGVCLDNDDLDLMAQEGVPLIITPTASAGYGYGYSPVCAAVRRGIRIGIGTMDGKYNKRHDLSYELSFLEMTANAEMRCEHALDPAQLNRIISFS